MVLCIGWFIWSMFIRAGWCVELLDCIVLFISLFSARPVHLSHPLSGRDRLGRLDRLSPGEL